MTGVVLYALLWVSFGGMHSVLTMPVVKAKLVPLFGRGYRLAYNIFALLHFLLVYAVGFTFVSHQRFSVVDSNVAILAFGLIQLLGLFVMLLALRQYDLSAFSGFAQLRSRNQEAESVEPLNKAGMNKWVRHPLYSGLFLFVWSAATSPFGLCTAIFASLYLLIGSRYEEKKLVDLYGADYSHYKAKVPAFLPRF